MDEKKLLEDENFIAMVKAELRYPEDWDTMAYPTVWHALWEEYLGLKEKAEALIRALDMSLCR